MNENEPLNPGEVPAPPPEEVVPMHVQVPESGAETESSSPALPVDPEAQPVKADEPMPASAEVARAGAVRPLPQTLTAASDAAAFVAQLFTDVGAPDSAASSAEAEPSPGEAAQDGDDAVPATNEPSDETVLLPLQGQHVLILGLGASGLAMTRWCVRQGAQVTVVDTREGPPQLAQLQAELPQVSWRHGGFEPGLIEGSDIRAVFKSPGLSPASVASLWSAAQAMGLWVGGELDLFARALRDLQAESSYAPKVLAITGTNGKTTTASLTGQLVADAEKTVAVAGNIGPSLLDTLAEHIDAGTLPEVWVLELSSFQLDGVQGFEPTAAVVLNLTQDHLDWHGSMQAYGAAKARIFGERALMILNRDDAAVMAMLPEPVRVKLQKPQWRDYVSFGLESPQRPGDYGIEMVNGMAWLVRAQEADETRKKRKGEEEELFIQRLMPADALRIRGRHNATNALAALALASAAGCSLAPMLYGLREYRGEPHRVEPVGVIDEVEFFDDSKGTNVGATVAALNGLGADRKVVVILGGDGKGQDFTPLATPVSRFARAVVLIGRDAGLIREVLTDCGVPLVDATSMEQAIGEGKQLARPGDAVLLSPACASFDMFDNYGHRAKVFCDAVHQLAQDAGMDIGGLS